MPPLEMFEKIFKVVFDALPPEKQAIVGSFILAFGAFVVALTWMSWRRPVNQQTTQESLTGPVWLSLGPAHEAMEAMHELAEQSRVMVELQRSNHAVLRDIDKSLTDLNRGQAFTHALLESIVRNQELGIHPTLVSPLPKRKSG